MKMTSFDFKMTLADKQKSFLQYSFLCGVILLKTNIMTQRKLLLFSTLFLSFLFIQDLEAQNQRRFRAGFVLGLNASQIRGDDTGGYNRLGLVGGLRGIALFTEKMDLNIELLYSERGAKSSNEEQLRGFDVDIRLQYVEVPVLWTYKDWLEEEKNYYKVQAVAGFSFSRLLQATSEGATTAQNPENFDKNDFSFVIGAEFFASPKWSFSARVEPL